MKKIFAAISLFIILNSSSLFGQDVFGVGAFIGGGTIKGNSPAQGSYTASIFIETNMPFVNIALLRLSFLYAADFNSILPDSRVVYNSFVKGITLKMMLSQPLENNFYLEEGMGLLLLNDRTFSDTDIMDAGLAASLLAGIDFRNNLEADGFRLGAGVEYGLTFTNTLASYISFHLQGEYFF